jgi:hypothetical protein
MDWSNEPYVRVYTRDTKTWLKLRWEGQTLLMMLFRKVDRAGVLDDIDDPVDDLTLMTGLPVEVVEVGLRRLLEMEVVAINDGQLVIPNYIEAQESSKTDRQRQRECRERRRARALVTKRDHGVTERDKKSQPVTGGHELSQPVTLTSADPIPDPGLCSADPDPLEDLPAATAPGRKKKSIKKVNNRPKTDGSRAFVSYSDAYRRRYGADPVRNNKVNSLFKRLVERLGAEEAPEVASHYLTNNARLYVASGHAPDLLIRDAEKLRTEWATGRQVTSAAAQEADRLQKTGEGWKNIIAEHEEKEGRNG